jgi:hypothetical protein
MMETYQNMFGEWVAKCDQCGFEWLSVRQNIAATGDIRGEVDGPCPQCAGVGVIVGTND